MSLPVSYGGTIQPTAVSICCFIFCSGRQAPLPTKPHGVELSRRGKWFSQRSQKAFTAESLPTLTEKNHLPVTTWRADAWRVEGGGRCLLLHPPLLQLHWPLSAQVRVCGSRGPSSPQAGLQGLIRRASLICASSRFCGNWSGPARELVGSQSFLTGTKVEMTGI